MNTGDIYRREASGAWTKIGGPGQAFLSLGNTLYGQTPGGGYLVRYLSGQSWQGGISGYNGQVLRCASTLCATNPSTGQIAEYSGSGSAWTYIGGAGARFASSETQLFGIEPHQANVALRSPSGWYWTDSGTTTSRELVGGGTSMYRLLTESFGNVQRFNGSSWQSLGTFGVLRQLHATGSNLYAISGSSSVYQYNGSGWSYIGSSAAPVSRLYGSYGQLYGQAADGTVYSYASGQWVSLGRP
jgi:hypothetical protein